MNTKTQQEVKVLLDIEDVAKLDAIVQQQKLRTKSISRATLLRRAVKDYLNRTSNSVSIGG